MKLFKIQDLFSFTFVPPLSLFIYYLFLFNFFSARARFKYLIIYFHLFFSARARFKYLIIYFHLFFSARARFKYPIIYFLFILKLFFFQQELGLNIFSYLS